MRSRSGVGLALVFMGLLAAPRSGVSQDAAERAVLQLRPGQVVRVEAPGLAVEEGTVTEVADVSFVVAQEAQEWVIQTRALERLEVRRRSIVPSVLVFAGAGVVAGFVVNKMLDESDPDPTRSSKIPIGAAIGAGIGFAVGMNRWTWRVVFPE